MSELVIKKSEIKNVVGSVNVSWDFYDAFDKKARQLVLDAVERAKQNHRNTVMAKDL